MGTATTADGRFLAFVTELLLCSRCFGRGIRTPVSQPISHRHRPLSLCRECRARELAGHH